ncbi:hypothetical protein GNP80_15180 [Aliivibrio fischeri]|uniref:hypothetical protein n=1 Tax=Aliivibrio fischeri TaxID=668 RepID=UPI0012DACE1B|nr:hypothetical protein [Aliivibrio fischeri]MUK93773.1 hypothetical protein [Aliivibrio fischeri]
MKHWVSFESVEIKRDGYYVKYDPLTIGRNERSAFVSVRILESKSPQQCKEIAEEEYLYWISLFNIPLQVNIRYEIPCRETVSQLTGCSYICGVTPNTYRWGGFLTGELDGVELEATQIKRIYRGLQITTSSEVNARLNTERKGRQLLQSWALISLVILPALIAFLGWSNPIFSTIALMFAWYKCADKWLCLTRKKIKTDVEEEKEVELRLKEHHHYHCMKNPKGFEKLKLDNFRNNQANKLAQKLKSMASGMENKN